MAEPEKTIFQTAWDAHREALDWNDASRVDHIAGAAKKALEEKHLGILYDLQMENYRLKQALGYPIPAEFDTPNNPFRCGSCDAKSQEAPCPRT